MEFTIIQKKSTKTPENIQTFLFGNRRVALIAKTQLSVWIRNTMQIKGKIETIVVTKRRFVIRQTPVVRQTDCAECGEPMLPISQTAVLFRQMQSRIFQIVETGAAHFTEAEAGELMICLTSLAAVLDSDSEEKTEEINES
jgi:hypothetical protein